MVNGLLTLRGAWDRVREDPILKFLVVARHGLRHGDVRRADAVAEERERALALHGLDHRPRAPRRAGWNGFLTFGDALLALPADFYHTTLYSHEVWRTRTSGSRTLGIVFYADSACIRRHSRKSLMWKRIHAGWRAAISEFLETVLQIVPMYALRAVGGTFYICGALIMAYNLYKTAKLGSLMAKRSSEAPPLRDKPLEHDSRAGRFWHRLLEAKPILFCSILVACGADRWPQSNLSRLHSSSQTSRPLPV